MTIIKELKKGDKIMFRKAQHEQSLVGEIINVQPAPILPHRDLKIARTKDIKVTDLYEARVQVDKYSYLINDGWDFHKLPHSEKVQDFGNVEKPAHYNYGVIEVIDFAEQVCSQYTPELAPHIYNAIKYLSRAEHKNGKEDIKKAHFSVQRIFDKWDRFH